MDRSSGGGGQHLENVLTTPVMSAPDLLPRTWFLGEVLAAATGADQARARTVSRVEDAVVDGLPGDLNRRWSYGTAAGWTIHPDALLHAPESLICVEPKAPSGRLQPGQVARRLLAVLDAAGGRTRLLPLIVGTPPPIPLTGHGRMDLAQALELGLASVPEADAFRLRTALAQTVASIAWNQIAASAHASLAALPDLDPTVRASIERTAQRLRRAVQAAGP